MNISKLAGVNLPSWARLIAIALAAACLFLLGVIWGERSAGEREIARTEGRADQVVKVARAQIQVVTKTETKYRDRIRTIYLKGETIENDVPLYVTPADSERFGVNAGFVRVLDAAWANEPAGPAAGSDREPAGIPLTDIAETEAHNARACHAWREQALGLREFYRGIQAVSNGSTAKEASQ